MIISGGQTKPPPLMTDIVTACKYYMQVQQPQEKADWHTFQQMRVKRTHQANQCRQKSLLIKF